MLRTFVHLLVSLALALNGMAWAHVAPDHAQASVTTDPSQEAGRTDEVPEASLAAPEAAGDGECGSAHAATESAADSASDCCGEVTCDCGCVPAPAVARPAAAWPQRAQPCSRFVFHPRAVRVARAAAPFRPPAA